MKAFGDVLKQSFISEIEKYPYDNDLKRDPINMQIQKINSVFYASISFLLENYQIRNIEVHSITQSISNTIAKTELQLIKARSLLEQLQTILKNTEFLKKPAPEDVYIKFGQHYEDLM